MFNASVTSTVSYGGWGGGGSERDFIACGFKLICYALNDYI